MSREIKFQAWDTYNRRMVKEPYRFQKNDPLAMKAVNTQPWQKTPWLFYEDLQDIQDGIDRPCYIMQFTGLTDNYHNDIFEDDLLRSGQGHFFHVIWHDDKAGWAVRCLSGEHSAGIFTLEKCMEENLEKVGNIHENPEIINS